ncbi:MAG: hypothetical protein Q9227_007722 [Pyrenula ochraceoflavens]
MEALSSNNGDSADGKVHQPGSWHPAMRPDNDYEPEVINNATLSKSGDPLESFDNSHPPDASANSLQNGSKVEASGVVPSTMSFSDVEDVLKDDKSSGIDQTFKISSTEEEDLGRGSEGSQNDTDLRKADFFTAQDDEAGQDKFFQELTQPSETVNDHVNGLRRQDTDLKPLLSGSYRTSTFPTLPDEDVTYAEKAEPLPASQAHAIMNTAEATDDIVELTEGSRSDEHVLWLSRSDPNAEDASFFNGTLPAETAETAEPNDDEARFEEGVPLMSSDSHDNKLDLNHQGDAPSLDEMFNASGDMEEERFFTQPHQARQVNSFEVGSPPTLDRKSTAQVLNQLQPEMSETAGVLTHSAIGTGDSNAQESVAQGGNAPLAPDNTNHDISDPWKAAFDDDEFLIEDADDLLSDSDAESQSSFLAELKAPERQVEATIPATKTPTSNMYTPHQPSTSDLAQGIPNTNMGSAARQKSSYGASVNQVYGQPTRPNVVQRAESFADQAKGGYKSPYDLPMDVTKPRKRVQMSAAVPTPTSAKPPPPPRSSSITSNNSSIGQSQISPTSAGFQGAPRPQSSRSSFGAAMPGTPQQSSGKSKSGSSSFFEELPITAKSRPSNMQGRYTPQSNPSPTVPPPPATFAHPAPPQRPTPPSAVSASPSSSTDSSQFRLQRPERLDPFPPMSAQSPGQVPTASRYSPAPAPIGSVPKPPSGQRYSPAPPPSSQTAQPKTRYASQPNPSSMPPPPSIPFQPRTSSPLAHHEGFLPSQPQPHMAPATNLSSQPPLVNQNLPVSGHGLPPHNVAPSIPEDREISSGGRVPLPPLTSSISQQALSGTSPQDQSSFGASLSGPQSFSPPKRSHTSSPGRRDIKNTITSGLDYQRPASALGQASPVQAIPSSAEILLPRPPVRQRGVSQSLNFVAPTDGLELDDLQRWRGSPIFRFGFGGNAVTCFPKHIPRYMAGQAVPVIKPLPGEVKVQSTKSMLPFVNQLSKFPGPLRSKSKKKELLAWLSDRIALFEQQPVSFPNNHHFLPDPQRRHEEKILLWKLVKVLVEQDGVVEGKPEAVKAAVTIVCPELDVAGTGNTANIEPVASPSGIYQSAGYAASSRPVDLSAVERIRQSLLRGEREKAVWNAVDGGLWSHALLLASTLDKSIWRQVTQEFVRQEVKTVGQNTESLAALYEIFAGNLEESVDELVPPSARAGLQMVSKVSSTGPVKNAIEGLDRWRETLALVLNNRSLNDYQALAALGRLLASYGRTEAAHCCFLFSRAPQWPSIFGASDDPQTSIVLLGADHRQPGIDISLDEDAILLTETYEYATSVLAAAANTSSLMPHLQAFKLHHAMILADNGLKTEAQQYCDVIANTMKMSTKASPYHHAHFFAQLDDLTRRLQQAPVDGSSSWISKPSMEKVSGSVWNKLSNFIAGDESDAASTGSGKDTGGEFGPFAKMAGTPTISRAPSVSDFNGGYSNPPPSIPATAAAARYAPTSQYVPQTQFQGRSSLDSQRSPSYDLTSTQQHQQHMQRVPSPYQAAPTTSQYQSTPPSSSYAPVPRPDNQHFSPYKPESYVPTPPPEQTERRNLYSPSSQPPPDYQSVPAPVEQQEPAYGGYEPQPSIQPPAHNELGGTAPGTEESYFPTTSPYGYEPPTTYTPYVPEPDSPPPAEPAEVSQRQASLTQPEEDAAEARKRRDREAEENFRRVAEQEAERDKKKPADGPGDKTVRPRASWFGSLMSFGKSSTDLRADSNADAGKKIIRAKLGEESSFYYDPDLKKWVNRKDPNSATVSARATPPPPRAPSATAIRSVSSPASSGLSPLASMPPPPLPSGGLPSRNASPASTGTPPQGTSGSPAPSTLGTAPGLIPPPPSAPSRPASAVSNANNIDDLLGGGPPTARKAGAAAKGKKKGRGYVDVMAK